jgi:hypothetical protein
MGEIRVNQTIKSKEILVAFAKTAAINFTKNQIPLNDSLSKIARDEGLIPDQVRFLVQETNKQAWADLYKTNKDAAYDFPLADCGAVLDQVKDDFSTKIVKDYDMDYMSQPVVKVATRTIEKVASVEGRSKKEIHRELNQKLEKLAYLKSDLHAEFLLNNTLAESTSELIVKDLKNELLEMPFSKRAEAFRKFATVAHRHVPGEGTLSKMASVQHALERLGVMQKTAALEAPEELISKGMPAEIINGNNILMIRVKTLMNYNRAAQDAYSRLSLVDDTIPQVKEAIREL